MSDAGEISISAELIRKGIHLFALVIPIGYYLVPFPIAIIVLSVSAAVSSPGFPRRQLRLKIRPTRRARTGNSLPRGPKTRPFFHATARRSWGREYDGIRGDLVSSCNDL